MTARCTPARSLSQRRADNGDNPRNIPEPLMAVTPRLSSSKSMASELPNSHLRPLSTSNKSNNPHPSALLPSTPASPPTPAPSPAPHQRTSSWQSGDEEEEDALLLNARMHFDSLSVSQKQKFLVDLLGLCDNQLLSFVSSFVSPLLRKDPFQTLPNELCLRVMRRFRFRAMFSDRC
jgi:F-box and WD-40 domain protein CDC4